VVFLITGRSAFLLPILAYYAVLDLALRYLVAAAHRLSFEVRAWQVVFDYTTPLQGPLYSLVVALIAIPLVVAIVGYGLLYFKAEDRATRYRIAMVTVGLLLWVSTEALAASSGFSYTTAGELVRRLVALVSTGLLFSAYRPPVWARRRLGARPTI
jgi:hypothetical protein